MNQKEFEKQRKKDNAKLIKTGMKSSLKKENFDKNTRKANIIKAIYNIVVVMIAVILSEMISKKWFDESFIAVLIAVVLIILVLTPVNIAFENYINKKFYSADE